MEFWKQFVTHRKKNDANKKHKISTGKQESSPKQGPGGTEPPFPLQKDGVRVLLFRDCDTRGRKLLYDSKTVVQVPLTDSSTNVPSCKPMFWGSGSHGGTSQATGRSASNISTSSASSSKADVYAEVSRGYGYQYKQQESDTKTLGDLVFGSVALTYRGSCSKLHLLQDPHRLLLSRIAPAPASHLRPSAPGSDQGIEAGSIGSSISSLGEGVNRAESLEVPWGPGRSLAWEVPRGLSATHSEGDSGYGGPPSPYSSTCGSFLSPPSLPPTPHGTPSSRQGSGNSLKNSGSLNSLQRRFLRNVTTSLEALGEAGSEDGGSQGHHQRRSTKLGIAVIIQLGDTSRTELNKKIEEWLFLHMGVIEGALERLQRALDRAYLHRHTFVSTTHHAVARLQQDLVDVVCGARLVQPVWLGLLSSAPGVTGSGQRRALCSFLVDTLSSVLHAHDTKTTNFFVSKLLTAVLTYHLGWVSTVAPSDAPSTSASITTPSQPAWVERLAESHPYSAVWAQLCELGGAIGYPPRTARTLILGSNSALLNQLLTVLSYVIRCSQVVEQDLQINFAENCADSQQTQCQQPVEYSRTSSMASIVTVVEGERKDSQRDFSARDSSAGQNSFVHLQRESSIRRSRRKIRESRSGRLTSPGEARPEGDGTKGVNHSTDETVADPISQGPCQKEVDQASKWMLNDGEEIDVRGGAKMLVPLDRSDSVGQFSCRKDTALGPIPREVLSSSNYTPKTLSTCKTSTNLACLIDDDDDDDYCLSIPDSSYSESVSMGNNNNSIRTSEPDRLYPTLHDLDDHRETFGPVVLEPLAIAGKVQKLFRALPKQNSPQELNTEKTYIKQYSPQEHSTEKLTKQNSPDKLAFYQSSKPSLITEDCVVDRNETKESRSEASSGNAQSVISVTTLPRTKKSQNAVGVGFIYECAQVHENKLKRVGSVRSSTSGIMDEVRVPAKDIHAEVEEGGKVLLISEGLSQLTCRGSQISSGQNNKSSKVTNISTIGFEGVNDIKNNKDLVTCLPSPVDTRKLVRMRNVGRESARDLTNLEKEKVIYPSLQPFKQDSILTSDCRYTDDLDIFIKKHRRHHSDPTNGQFTTKLMKPDVAESLNFVAEETITDRRGSIMEITIQVPSTPHKPVRKTKDQEETLMDKGKTEIEKREGSQERDSGLESSGEVIDQAIDQPCINKEPVSMPMPKCGACGHTSQAGSSSAKMVNLAGSLMGGVQDHYSSVFVMHGTTQIHNWEDTLRQDLYTAAHRPTVDQPIAEAVAIVANTESWEVQVVSSHSYVVERGAGVGIEVGMSPLVSAFTDSILHLTRLKLDPVYIVQHLEERLSELYLKSQLLASYLLEGAEPKSSATLTPHHLPDLTRALGLDLNDLPLLLAVASTHTPELTRMFGLSFR